MRYHGVSFAQESMCYHGVSFAQESMRYHGVSFAHACKRSLKGGGTPHLAGGAMVQRQPHWHRHRQWCKHFAPEWRGWRRRGTSRTACTESAPKESCFWECRSGSDESDEWIEMTEGGRACLGMPWTQGHANSGGCEPGRLRQWRVKVCGWTAAWTAAQTRPGQRPGQRHALLGALLVSQTPRQTLAPLMPLQPHRHPASPPITLVQEAT